MLLWQRQNSNFLTRDFFISRFFLLSLVSHVGLCFSLLFLYKDQQQHFLFTSGGVIPTPAQVRLLPLSMDKPAHQVLGVKGGKKGVQQGASSLKQQKKERAKKSPTTFVSPKTMAALSKKAQQAKEKAAKKVLQEKALKLEKKKAKALEAKKLKEQKLEEKKVQEALAKEPEKKPAPEVLPEEKAKEVPSIKEQLSEASRSSVADEGIQERTGIAAVAPEGQEFIYLTQQELDALGIQRKLQECLFDLWTIPVGIPVGTECEALISVGWDGGVVAIEYKKKSNILIYDLSVQEALEQVHFPHEVWGKQVTLVFKP